MWKWTISTIYWIIDKAGIFFFRDMKYQRPSCSGHGLAAENNEQPFKFIIIRLRKAQKFGSEILQAFLNQAAVMGTILPISARWQ